MRTQPIQSDKKVTLPVLLVVGFLAQIWGSFPLWNHSSDSGQFLGRYSYGYAAILILNLILIATWFLLLVRRRKLENQFKRLPARWLYLLVMVAGLAMLGIYLTSVETQIKQYIAFNWLLFSLVVIYVIPDRRLSMRWVIAIVLVIAAILIPIFVTALTERAFSPDEATWADYATSPFVAGGMYVRTWLREPLVIEPGRGWSTAIYGWLLENVSFDIKVGRIFNFVGYLLGFAGIGAVAARLYGREAAFVSVSFAVLSRSFFISHDYRPDHQLPLGLMLVTLAVLQARGSKGRTARRVWHFIAGLLATLVLQIHAAGIVFIFAFSLFYFVEFVIQSYRKRQLTALEPLIWFGAGIMSGMVLFYFLNIAPVGGFAVYFENLLRDRWGFSLTRRLAFLRWPSLPEWMVILGGFAYILWRRNQVDRLLLGLVGCIALGIFLLDSQGYRTTYNALYVIPVGTLVVHGFSDIAWGRKHLLILAGVLTVMVAEMSGLFINWRTVGDWLATGQFPPFLYGELRSAIAPYVSDDDVIVGTHELIWTFPDQRELYGYAAEYLAAQRLKVAEPKGVWEYVEPTLIIEVPNQSFDVGLVAYMDEHNFQVCQTLDVLDTPIRLYRTSCP
ncbi:MAG: hypothetical protein H6672_18115 [Anaerolineaceae bacterium]|nr:hypothetical protein [Anaerolineaceae bacterium]